MPFVKLADRVCGNCSHIDRLTYRMAKVSVCYLKEKKDGKAVAVVVTDKTPSCRYWHENE